MEEERRKLACDVEKDIEWLITEFFRECGDRSRGGHVQLMFVARLQSVEGFADHYVSRIDGVSLAVQNRQEEW